MVSSDYLAEEVLAKQPADTQLCNIQQIEQLPVTVQAVCTTTRIMVPICLRASSFLNLCQNNKHKQIQNQNATAFQHLLVSNKKNR